MNQILSAALNTAQTVQFESNAAPAADIIMQCTGDKVQDNITTLIKVINTGQHDHEIADSVCDCAGSVWRGLL